MPNFDSFACPSCKMGSIEVLNRKATARIAGLKQQEKTAVFDVTSRSDDPNFVKLSPMYPHGGIQVPGTSLITESVEGAWQGLKTFEKEGADMSKLRTKSSKNIKRSQTDRRGAILGHKINNETIGYIDARKRLYVPMYNDAIERHCMNELVFLAGLVKEGWRVILLDYETNCDVEDPSKPLSHAGLVISMVNTIIHKQGSLL